MTPHTISGVYEVAHNKNFLQCTRGCEMFGVYEGSVIVPAWFVFVVVGVLALAYWCVKVVFRGEEKEIAELKEKLGKAYVILNDIHANVEYEYNAVNYHHAGLVAKFGSGFLEDYATDYQKLYKWLDGINKQYNWSEESRRFDDETPSEKEYWRGHEKGFREGMNIGVCKTLEDLKHGHKPHISPDDLRDYTCWKIDMIYGD